MEFLASVMWIPFLLSSMFFGVMLLYTFVPGHNRLFLALAAKKAYIPFIPQALFYFPAGAIVGMAAGTAITFILTMLISPFLVKDVSVLIYSSIFSACGMFFAGFEMLDRHLTDYMPSFVNFKRELRKNLWKKNPQRAQKIEDRMLASIEKRERERLLSAKVPVFVPTFQTVSFYVISVLLFIWGGSILFYYSFYSSGGAIYTGQTVFSDLGPHIALITSFSEGRNFPVEYPLFPGNGIPYHFLFFFLCGILNSLGLPLPHALNIPSLIALLCCLCLLGTLAVLMSGRSAAFLFPGVLVMFRHSVYVVTLFRDILAQNGGDYVFALQTLLSQNAWFGNTAFDHWGLWSVNVYANQRHFFFGIALLLVCLFFFLPYVKRMIVSVTMAESLTSKIRIFFFSKDSWIPGKDDILHPWQLFFLSFFTVVIMPYFHGSALITLLLILFVLAIFSKARLLFLFTAIGAVISSLLQTTFFSGGAEQIISMIYQPGFLAESTQIMDIVTYLFRCFGFLVPLYIGFLLLTKGNYRRVLLLSFAAPVIFAFQYQVTKEMAANHKFLQISIDLFSVFLSMLLSFLLFPFSKDGVNSKTEAFDPEKGGEKPLNIFKSLRPVTLILSRVAAVVFLLILTANGIAEWGVYRTMNKGTLTMPTDSLMVSWVKEETPPKSVFLTFPYAYHNFFLTGRFAYYGHPYYAWSAGLDTDARLVNYQNLLSGCNGDIDAFIALCEEENISYILLNDDLRSGEFPVNEEFFQQYLPVAEVFPVEGNAVIYEIA